MELVDLFDKNRNKINKKHVKYEKLNDGEYQVIVHVCVFNSKDEMLIQRRGIDKIDWPNYWDISSGGGVIAGEEPYKAAERELFEELGVKISLENERPYFTINYPLGFDDYYLVNLDLPIESFTIDKEEVLNIKWASLEEIKAMMKNDEFINYNDGFIELLFSMKNNRGTYKRK